MAAVARLEADAESDGLPMLENTEYQVFQESWKHFCSGDAVSESIEMDDYVLGNSCVFAAEEVTKKLILNDVIGKSENEERRQTGPRGQV